MKVRTFLLVCIAILLVFSFTFVFAGKGGEKAEGPVELVFWWWGEQEAAGLEGWVNETVELFEAEYPNITVETVLQATENVIDDFTMHLLRAHRPTCSICGTAFTIRRMCGSATWSRWTTGSLQMSSSTCTQVSFPTFRENSTDRDGISYPWSGYTTESCSRRQVYRRA